MANQRASASRLRVNGVRPFNPPRLVGLKAPARLPCAHKHRHPSRGAAEAHRRSLERRYGPLDPTLESYACRHCDGWHVGNSRQNGSED